MRRSGVLPILLLACGIFAEPMPGQEAAWTVQETSSGWIGFYFEFAKAAVDGRERTVALITEVVQGSPAELAEMKAGDLVTHLDGQPVSPEIFASLRQTLEPGDLVRLTVVQDGQTSERLVEAARPPARIVVTPDADEMIIHLETLSEGIVRNLDSVRLSIEGLRVRGEPGEMSVRVLRSPADSLTKNQIGFSFQMRDVFLDSLAFGPDVFLSAPDFGMPFEALIVQSDATLGLKEELALLRKELTGVQRAALARQRELSAAIQGSTEQILREDETYQQYRAQEAALVAEQAQLTERLKQVSEEELQRQWAEVTSRSEEAFLQAQRAQIEALRDSERNQREFERRSREIYQNWEDREADRGEWIRFRSPIIEGQTVVYGAQLAPLNPQLAEYFSVEHGVMVIEVLEDTPAADAGLQGGDIIVSVGGEEVATLSDLRFGLAAFEGPLQVGVIRKGEPVEVQIRR
ncbi:MAG: PDZ domain-containing protein [Gemmatimonadota bacterium]